jgi:hypothetical protein
MSLKKQIESEITFLQAAIGDDPSNLSEELQLLRSLTMVIHFNIESYIENLIAHHVTEPFKKLVTNQEDSEMKISFWISELRTENLITDMDFVKKVNFLEKVDIINKESKIKGKLMKINDLRVMFSHPISHSKKIKLLEEEKNYLEALHSLRGGYISLSDYFIEKKFGIKKYATKNK